MSLRPCVSFTLCIFSPAHLVVTPAPPFASLLLSSSFLCPSNVVPSPLPCAIYSVYTVARGCVVWEWHVMISLVCFDLDFPLDDLQAAVPFAWVKSLWVWCPCSRALLLGAVSYFTHCEYHAQKLTIFHHYVAGDTNRICYKRKQT